MVIVRLKQHDLYFDGYLLSNLEFLKKSVRDDWDSIGFYDGGEGTGKSNKCFQDMAYFTDGDFNIDDIAFNSTQFETKIKKARQYGAVVFDEGFRGLSGGVRSLETKKLISLLMEIRQKNLFVGIVMPTIFEADRYAGIFRAKYLEHIYLGDNWERGYFSFYNYERKKDLFMKGKKFFEYKVPPNFRGRFTKNYFVDPVEYKEAKLKAMTTQEEKVTHIDRKFKRQRDSLIAYLHQKGHSFKDIEKALDGVYSHNDLLADAIHSSFLDFNKRYVER